MNFPSLQGNVEVMEKSHSSLFLFFFFFFLNPVIKMDAFFNKCFLTDF